MHLESTSVYLIENRWSLVDEEQLDDINCIKKKI